jgi:hypothetical protein
MQASLPTSGGSSVGRLAWGSDRSSHCAIRSHRGLMIALVRGPSGLHIESLSQICES